MCRIAAYLGPPARLSSLLGDPPHGLTDQSRNARMMTPSSVAGDGWAVGWFLPEAGPVPGLLKSDLPLWSDENGRTATHAVLSGSIVGHVRLASPGTGTSRVNTPLYALDGHLWTINGMLQPWPGPLSKALRDRLDPDHEADVRGSTDGELLGALWRTLFRHARGPGRGSGPAGGPPRGPRPRPPARRVDQDQRDPVRRPRDPRGPVRRAGRAQHPVHPPRRAPVAGRVRGRVRADGRRPRLARGRAGLPGPGDGRRDPRRAAGPGRGGRLRMGRRGSGTICLPRGGRTEARATRGVTGRRTVVPRTSMPPPNHRPGLMTMWHERPLFPPQHLHRTVDQKADRSMAYSRETEIGRILGGRPSRNAFHLLGMQIGTRPGRGEAGIDIPEIESSLSRWLSMTRHIQVRGCEGLRLAQSLPVWPLIRSLCWNHIVDDPDELGEFDNCVKKSQAFKNIRAIKLIAPGRGLLRRLRLNDFAPNLNRLTIDLYGGVSQHSLSEFLHSSLPRSLKSLTLIGADSVDDHASDNVFDTIDAIVASPVGARLRSIRLPNMEDASLAYFLDKVSRPLSDIGHQSWSVEMIDRLCRRGVLAAGLKRLDLLACGLGGEGADLIARCSHFGRLQHLDLGANEIGPDQLARVLEAPFIPRLERLHLHGNPLGDAGWKLLGHAPFRALRILDLSATEATGSGARSLGRAVHLDSLRSFHLCGSRVGDGGISAILDSRFAPGLRHLNLTATGQTPATAALLASRPLARLRTLDLSFGLAGSEVGRQLARSARFSSLSELRLRGLGLGDEGVEQLAKATGFPRLQCLDLRANDLTDRGIGALASSPLLSTIRELLLLSNPGIGEKGVLALSDSAFGEHLLTTGLESVTGPIRDHSLEGGRVAGNLMAIYGEIS